MAKIQILDDIVVNQIAAGEVVERPASVVKELVENSIDAKASEITVVISQGGSSLIEIIDNGQGMVKSDALLAIERFGTSKITSVDDLLHIGTHGFRGEALPSIASVSRFVLSTRSAEDEKATGTEIEIAGGVLKGVTEKPLPKGTRISVQNLFYNIPARRRFLRSDKTEAGLIKTQLFDFAAAYPYLRIKLISDGSETLNLSPCSSFNERLEQLKLEDPNECFFINSEAPTQFGPLRLKGLLSVPVASVAASGKLRLLVNGRSIRDRVILKAVRDGYGTMIKPGKYPSGVVSIEIPPEEVDVNVHPQKAEVRFRSPEKIYQLVIRAVGNALSNHQPAYVGNPEQYEQHIEKPAYLERPQPAVQFFAGSTVMESKDSYDSDLSSWAPPAAVDPVPRAFGFIGQSNPAEPLSKAEDYSDLRFVGQVLGCFLLFEGVDRFVILDMHAAHERVTFYQLKKGFLEGSIAKQQLLIAEEIAVKEDEIESFEIASETLGKLGFKSELIGNNLIRISEVPALFQDLNIRELFRDLLSLELWHSWSEHLDRKIDDILARIACHGSVRSGRILQKEEAYKLLEGVSKAAGTAYCPHGRPIAKVFSRSDLETIFGRIQQ